MQVLLIEVLSPSTARVDRRLKFSSYAEPGVPQYWIVDPGTAETEPTVEVYDLVDGAYVLQGRALGNETLAVSGVVRANVTPAALIGR